MCPMFLPLTFRDQVVNLQVLPLEEADPALALICPDLVKTNGAFPLHGMVRFGTAQYGTVRLSSGRFAFPLQFSTVIEWAGLFTCRYNCAASTAVTSS